MTTQNNDLTNPPNIGRTLAEKLKMAGISTPGDLLKIKTIDEEACINMLFAFKIKHEIVTRKIYHYLIFN
jgi:hypothetical protein